MKHMFWFFCNIIISCSFLYRLVTYHWKGFKDSYNFVVGGTSIKTHVQKLRLHKISDAFAPREKMVVPWGNLGPFLPDEHGCSMGQFKLVSPQGTTITRRKKPFSNQPVFDYMSSSTYLQLHKYIYFSTNSKWPTSHLKLINFLIKLVNVRCWPLLLIDHWFLFWIN
jgi:hypothetical protein